MNGRTFQPAASVVGKHHMQAIGFPAEKSVPLPGPDPVRIDPDSGQVPCRQKHHIPIEPAQDFRFKFFLHKIVKQSAGGNGNVPYGSNIIAAYGRKGTGQFQCHLPVNHGVIIGQLFQPGKFFPNSALFHHGIMLPQEKIRFQTADGISGFILKLPEETFRPAFFPHFP